MFAVSSRQRDPERAARTRSSRNGLWPDRQFVGLGAIQALLLLSVIAYSLWPPVPDSPAESDRWLVPVVVALVACTLLLAPRLSWWGLDVSVAATWLLLATLTATRATGQGQIVLGLTVLVLAVFVVYFLPRRRAFIHVALMVGLYGIALISNSHIVGPFLVFLVVLTMLLGAMIMSGLRETERRYRLIVDNAAEVIFHSNDGVVQWISPSVADVLGWLPEELIGTSIHRLWHPEDHEAAIALRDDAYRGDSGLGVFRFLTRDHDYIWIEISFKPYGARGRGGIVGTMRDVSARVAAEQALIASEQEYRMLAEIESERLQQLASLDDAKSRLFQNISHELRTPIAVIQAPLHGLLKDHESRSLTEHQRADIEAAARAADSLQRLVDGLLDVARGQAGQLVVMDEPTDLAGLTHEAVAMFRSSAEQAGLGLTVSSAGFPPVVRIDRDLWLKILLNLVSNALKFTREGEVSVHLRHDGTYVELRVSDSGVGISDEDLPHIFERFQQARNQPVHGQAGSGLGLALVAELVRAVGGSISVETNEGLGTSFSVRMPAERCVGPATPMSTMNGVVSTDATWLAAPAVPAHEERGEVSQAEDHRGRILLVEDHEDLRAYIARVLGDAGWSVTAVGDAEEAQARLPGHDLLLSDVMLPGVDGFELVRWVRAQESLRWTPIILLTARAGRESVLEGLGAGADDFVSKPFDPDELVARVGTHLELSLLRRVVLDEADDRAENLQRALGTNRVIGTALGILMVQERITADQAFTRLREASQTSNRKLRDVADDVVFTGTLSA